MVAQRDVAHKTNELPEVRTLLEPLDLRGWAGTPILPHGCAWEPSSRCPALAGGHRPLLAEDKNAASVFTAAKDNQPGLVATRDALPWQDVQVSHVMTGRGDGRAEQRTIQVLPAPDSMWPHASKVFLIERYVRKVHGTLKSAVAALGLTALTAAQPAQNG